MWNKGLLCDVVKLSRTPSAACGNWLRREAGGVSTTSIMKISFPKAKVTIVDKAQKQLEQLCRPYIPMSERLDVTPSPALLATPQGYTKDGKPDSGHAAPHLDSDASSLSKITVA
jgi:hypothetical protein